MAEELQVFVVEGVRNLAIGRVSMAKGRPPESLIMCQRAAAAIMTAAGVAGIWSPPDGYGGFCPDAVAVEFSSDQASDIDGAILIAREFLGAKAAGADKRLISQMRSALTPLASAFVFLGERCGQPVESVRLRALPPKLPPEADL